MRVDDCLQSSVFRRVTVEFNNEYARWNIIRDVHIFISPIVHVIFRRVSKILIFLINQILGKTG